MQDSQAQALISQPKDVKHWMLKHSHLASNIKAQAPIAAPQGCLVYRIHEPMDWALWVKTQALHSHRCCASRWRAVGPRPWTSSSRSNNHVPRGSRSRG